jgi:predicted RNA-binding Zn-ribbon protein involved in translation (DUF1610 family)
MPDDIQLEFACPHCHLSGLTPEVDRSTALDLSRAFAHLPCPRCGDALRILDTPGGVKRKLKGPGSVMMIVGEDHSLSLDLREVRKILEQEKSSK